MRGEDPALSALRTGGIVAACGIGLAPGSDSEQVIELPSRVLDLPCRDVRRDGLRARSEAEQMRELVADVFAPGIGLIPMRTRAGRKCVQ